MVLLRRRRGVQLNGLVTEVSFNVRGVGWDIVSGVGTNKDYEVSVTNGDTIMTTCLIYMMSGEGGNNVRA